MTFGAGTPTLHLSDGAVRWPQAATWGVGSSATGGPSVQPLRPNDGPGIVAKVIQALTQAEIELHSPVGTMAFDAEQIRAASRFARLRLSPIEGLQRDWDSYGGQEADGQALDYAERLLTSLALTGAPIPAVVPTRSGGIQLEWHRPSAEFVIAIPARAIERGDLTAYYYDGVSEVEWDRSLAGLGRSLIDEVLASFAGQRLPVEGGDDPPLSDADDAHIRGDGVPDEAVLLRRIPPIHRVIGDPDPRRPSSAAFESEIDETGRHVFSVVVEQKLAELGGSTEDVLAGHGGFGLVALSAGALRALGLEIEWAPDPADGQRGLAHAHVVGETTRPVRRQLANSCDIRVWFD